MITHKKPYGIYHWDTFETTGEDILLVDEADTVEEAEAKVKRLYGNRISNHGADRVEIVDQQGEIVQSYLIC